MFFGRLRREYKSLSFRLGLLYAFILMLISGVLMLLTIHYLDSTVTLKDQEFVRAMLRHYAQIEQSEGRNALLKQLAKDRSYNSDNGMAVLVRDYDGMLQNLTVPFGWKPRELTRLLTPTAAQWAEIAKPDFKRHRSARPQRDRILYTGIKLSDGGRMLIGFSKVRRSGYLEDLTEFFGAFLAWTFVLSLLGGLTISRWVFRPIRDLNSIVKEVTSGAMGARVPIRFGNNELNELIRQFNIMLDRIEQLVGAMRDALDNVAHDLRTPLSRMRIFMERAVQSDDNALLKEALMDCAEETEQIQTMLKALMDISEAETGLMQLNCAEIDFLELAGEVTELFEYAAEDQRITFSVEISEGLTVWGDPLRLRQMLMNLVDNAIKYSRPGSQVAISAYAVSAGIEISVNDEGQGIESIDMERIFDRLYRVDRSRSKTGLGLGLSLVRAFAQAHGGSVNVSSIPGRGSRFTILLPHMGS